MVVDLSDEEAEAMTVIIVLSMMTAGDTLPLRLRAAASRGLMKLHVVSCTDTDCEILATCRRMAEALTRAVNAVQN